MALLKTKKNTAPKKEKAKEKVSSILKPRITEKATGLSNRSVYAFNIPIDANKMSVLAEVKKVYKVTPTGIRIVQIPKKKVFVRGRFGVKKGGKKVYVTLKKGDKIEFV